MLEGLLAPLRVVLQRSFADWLMVAATWLVIVCATTLLAIGVLYGDAVALSGLHQVLARADASETSVTVDMRVVPAELEAVDEVVSRQARRILGWTDGDLARSVRSGTYGLDGTVHAMTDSDLVVFAAVDGLLEYATLSDGDWPVAGADPLQAALSTAAATRLGLSVGDELSMASRAGGDRTIAVRIVGEWGPSDPNARYWLGDSLERTGMREGASFTLHGPLLVALEDLAGRVATVDLDVSWRVLPAFENLALDDVRWMRSDAAALERRIGAELGDDAYFSVTTGLPGVLRSADRSLLVSRSGVLVLTIQFVILAAYALVLVAGLLVEQRRVETALLRSRGASAGQVAWMAFLEGLLLVVPAALAAPWIALAALRAFEAAGPLTAAGVTIRPRVDLAALVVAAIAGLGCLLGLVLPALASGRGYAAVRQALGRQGNRTIAQRMGLDVALVALAVIGLWQLRLYGAPLSATVRGSVGLDPLLVAAPAIGLLAGGILALRVVPLAAELGERMLGGRRGLVAPLGARQLSRRPLRYTRSALLLMLAAALGTFATSYTMTWARSQADQAAYQAGADLRVEVSSFPDLPLWAIGTAYRQIEGVEAAMPVVADSFDVSGRAGGGQLLAVDSAALPDAIDVRPDLLGDRSLAQLAASLAPDLAGLEPIPLPGRPVALRIRLDTALENVPQAEPDGTVIFPGPLADTAGVGRLSVALRDAGGLVHVLDAGGELRAAAVGQELEVRLLGSLAEGHDLAPDHPLELLGVQLLVEPPVDTRVVGDIAVTGMDAIDVTGMAQPVALDAGGPDLGWVLELGSLAPAPAPTAPDRPRVVRFTERDPLFGGGDLVLLRLQPAALTAVANRPLPVVVSRSFADQTGSSVGDSVAIGSLTRRTQVDIVGVVDAFPTLEPAEPFAVLDLAGLALATFARTGQDLFADEWWLTVSDEAAVTETLSGEPYSTERITGRSALAAELADDPVSLGVVGALLIGSIAALIVAVVGFVVSAVVSTRERLGEFALLRAMGLSPGQLSAWLAFENAFLMAAGVLAGIGLGLVLSWLVLPFVTLTQEARAVVPPVLVEVPWFAIGGLVVVAGLVLAMAVAVIGFVLRRVPASGVLRAGQD